MRDRRFVIVVVLLVVVVLLAVLYGGRLEDLLLRMHGIHRAAHS